MNHVSEGAHKIADGGADRNIVVNDRDDRNFNQIDQSWILSEARYFAPRCATTCLDALILTFWFTNLSCRFRVPLPS